MVSSGFLQEPHGVTTQKTPFFIVTAVKTSNLTLYYYLLDKLIKTTVYIINNISIIYNIGRLCGLVVIVSAYIYRGSGFDSCRYIFLVGLERGPFSFATITDELSQ
jgi:hypothetical protein